MMQALRIAIVEDEPLAVERLELALRGVPAVEVVGSAHDGRAGLELIRRLKPDLVFLDIRMPSMDGIELADALAHEGGTAVIFLTAFGQYAVDAFELAAVDYLMKPASVERVRAAVERARTRISQSTAEERAAELRTLLDTVRRESASGSVQADPYRSLWVTDARGRVRVPVASIEWLEAERDYVRIHTDAGSHLSRVTLQALSRQLDPAQFFRVHRSAIVSLKAVTGLKRRSWGLTSVSLASGVEVPVGRPYLQELKSRLGMKAAPSSH
ncbi:MAG TPA: LytTR family DNA-binding domain-containing protein [Caulobacteraceae bacterium]|nr:LytTR family DNA-binding domain-containing protein [Caulobacteraceae bacterium]